MKTLYLTSSGRILVDAENNTADVIQGERESIRNIYMAKEPMHVVYGRGEYQKEFDVKKDDLIIEFYDETFKNKIVVVKNKDWVANLKDYNKREEEAKLEWAKQQASEPCECACGACTNCA